MHYDKLNDLASAQINILISPTYHNIYYVLAKYAVVDPELIKRVGVHVGTDKSYGVAQVILQ